MDIISQLQEQINNIAALTFNTFGSLQRDAPPVRLSPNYPDPPPNQSEDSANFAEQPKLMSAALVKAAKQWNPEENQACSSLFQFLRSNEESAYVSKFRFDVLVAALPVSETGEEAQLKKIAELQAENDAVGQELQRQLEAAEKELKQVQELFGEVADNCLNLKRPN